MAITYVNSAINENTSGGTTVAVTLAGVTAGNLLVAGVTTEAGATATGVATTVGTTSTWTKAAVGNNAALGIDASLWYTIAPASGSFTVTATVNGTDAPAIVLAEYTGNSANLSQIVDASGSGSGSSTAPGSTTAATSYATDLVVGVMGLGAGAPTITSTDVSVRQSFNNASLAAGIALGDKNVSATGTQTANFTLSVSEQWAAASAAFKDSAAPTLAVIVQTKQNTATASPAATGTLASAPVAGNTLVVGIAAKGGATASLSGWAVNRSATDSSNLGLTVLTKTAGAAEGTTGYSFTLSSGQISALVFYEINGTFDKDAISTVAAGTTSTSTPSITPAHDGSLLVAIFGKASGAGTSATLGGTVQSGWTKDADDANSTATTRARVFAQHLQQSTAAATSSTVTWITTTSALEAGYLSAWYVASGSTPITGSDSATESDGAPSLALSGPSDAATAAESPALAAAPADSDAATLSDLPALATGDQDGAALSEALVLAPALAGSDGAVLSEAAGISVALAGADAVTASESVVVQGTNPHATDAASLTDAVTTLTAATAGAESAALAESVALAASLSETAALSEQAALALGVADTAGTSATVAVGAALGAADSASAADSPSLATAVAGGDSATLGEIPSVNKGGTFGPPGMKIISRGVTVYKNGVSDAAGSAAVDASYGSYYAVAGGNSYALDLGATTYGQVFINWWVGNNTTAYYPSLVSETQQGGLGNYLLQKSASLAGPWTTIEDHTSTANPYTSKIVATNMAGFRYLQWTSITLSGSPGCFQVNVHDASASTAYDVLFFAGDSWSAEGQNKNDNLSSGNANAQWSLLALQQQIQAKRGLTTGTEPLLVNGGIGGITVSGTGGYTNNRTALFGDVAAAVSGGTGYVCIQLGTNDANTSVFSGAQITQYQTDLLTLIDYAISLGLQPLLATIPWGNNSQTGTSVATNANTLNTSVIKPLWGTTRTSGSFTRQVLPGPDLYAFFSTNQTLITNNTSGGGLHPSHDDGTGTATDPAVWASNSLTVHDAESGKNLVGYEWVQHLWRDALLSAVYTNSVAASESATASETPALAVSLAASDAASLTEGASVSPGGTTVSSADSAAASEGAALAAALGAPDAAGGSDRAALGAALTASDGGSATESPGLSAGTSAADGATLGESALAQPSLSATDSAAAGEGASLAASGTAGDAGTVSELVAMASAQADAGSAAENVGLALSGVLDPATLAEAAPGLALSAADAGTAGESPALTAGLAATDAGTLTEGAVVTGGTTPHATDAASLSDAATLSASSAASDSAAIAESAALATTRAEGAALSEAPAIALGAADAASAAEGNAGLALAISDAATGSDAPSLSAATASSDSGSLTDSASVSQSGSTVSGADTGSATEGASLAAASAGSDALVAADAATLGAGNHDTDAVVLAETPVLGTHLTASDAGAAGEQAGVGLARADAGTVSEAVALVPSLGAGDDALLSEAAVISVTLAGADAVVLAEVPSILVSGRAPLGITLGTAPTLRVTASTGDTLRVEVASAPTFTVIARDEPA